MSDRKKETIGLYKELDFSKNQLKILELIEENLDEKEQLDTLIKYMEGVRND